MLEIRDLSVHFGGVRAVDRIDLTVEDGEVFGVIGPNGSGKTTLLNSLTGVVSATGTVLLDGEALALGKPQRMYGAGISRVFQAPQPFPDLSCLENVLLASRDRRQTGYLAALMRRRAMLQRERHRWDRAMEALALVGLVGLAQHEVGSLTYGQRRLLEIARSVYSRPRLLLLDEPSAGLNDNETDVLAGIIERLGTDDTLSIIVVDHKLGFVERLCSRVLVMDFGRVIATGAPTEVWNDPGVIEAYIGVEEPA